MKDLIGLGDLTLIVSVQVLYLLLDYYAMNLIYKVNRYYV